MIPKDQADRIIFTVVGNSYKGFIPLFIQALRTWYWGRIVIGVVGEETYKWALINLPKIGDMTEIAIMDINIERLSNENIVAVLRFTEDPLENYDSQDTVLVVDADMLVFESPWKWHFDQMEVTCLPFAGHHGARKKPHRPEICPSWTGKFERFAGGMFCATRQWYFTTQSTRQIERIRASLPHNLYREYDEVMLARMIKHAGFDIPQSKEFPASLRGIHLGDFRPNMRHRWINDAKMMKLVTLKNCERFRNLTMSNFWENYLRAIKETISESQWLIDIFDNTGMYVAKRLMHGI